MPDFTFESLSDKIKICVSDEHRFGIDAFLLTYFSNYKMNDTVCDLGTGCGIIPLLMQRKKPPQKIFAIDIQSQAIEQLKLSIEKSSISGIIPICADLKTLWADAPVSRFSLVTCNPPYKADNCGIQNPDEPQRIARHETHCTIDDVCRAANRLLKFGGRLCLCNRPERLADVISAMKANGIEPKRIRFVSKNPSQAPWLFLIEGKKGSAPFLRVEPHFFTHSDSGYSNELNEIYSV